MNRFGLVVIGAHSGTWLIDLLEVYKNENTLLVEPVPYNIELLKENTFNYKNVKIEESAISSKLETKKFYFIKPESVKNLGKHWASAIGSFSKQHILNHNNKRFNVVDFDIAEINIKSITFSKLMEKYSISEIDMLQIDVEGYEFEILNTIDYENIKIKIIKFEFKHFDGTFKQGIKLDSIKKKLINFDYTVTKVDKENILAVKKS